MAHPNNLAVQPELEPILYTHFDQWHCEHDSVKAIGIARDLIQEWTDTTQIDFSSISNRYLELGQTKFFWKAAEIFARNGYLVYDGDAFFEVYEMITLQDMLAKLANFKLHTTNDGTLFFEDETWLAVFTQLPMLLKATAQLKKLNEHLESAMWSSIYDQDNADEVKEAEASDLYADLKESSELLAKLNIDEATLHEIGRAISL
ncbi:MAG: hypothetical protein CTY35_03630 [Methylotenera sp.]|nr:MAG: hypothetical protein CTY35_03630 [Methylotenera sp.]